MSNTIQMLKNYKTDLEQEQKDIEVIIKAEEIFGDIFTRENEFCHLTASSFVTNKERTKVLCIYHNIYKSWGWIGGHADGSDDMLFTARKETEEETSLKNFKELLPYPISVEILPVNGHIKRNKYVASHTHLNITYLFEADENEEIKILEDENSNVGWLYFDELLEKCEEPHMLSIYKKIINKIKELKI
ncbi:MAG: NUDIX hydrolase [Clostridia bacterium]|nr:NUDIX hydrolase [Clostridia bacterium]